MSGASPAGELPPGCAGVAPALVELALGVLAGEERSATVAHLESCAPCSALLVELSAAADDLLHLFPAAEPPVGFEARVFERLGLKQPALPVPAGRAVAQAGRPFLSRWRAVLGRRVTGRRRGWRFATALAVAAGMAAVFAGGALAGGAIGGGQRAGHAGGGSPSGPTALSSSVEMAALVSWGRPVGQVLVYAGNPTWVFMYMDDAKWSGPLRCQVLEDEGPAVTLGTFWLSGGKGAWAASVAQPAGRLRVARVVDASGHVLAVARLS